MHHVRLTERYGPTALHLYGATLGEKHLNGLLREIVGLSDGALVILDFTGVEAASASYLKATYGRLLAAAIRSAGSSGVSNKIEHGEDCLNIYPTVAGLSEDVRGEFDLLLAALSLPGVEAGRWKGEKLISGRVRGPLEGVLKETLQRVTTMRHATAFDMVDERLRNPTAWNNRLADLYRLRLVRRVKEGRQWVYTPIADEVTLG